MNKALINRIAHLKAELFYCPAGTAEYYKLFDELVELEAYRAHLNAEKKSENGE